MVGCQGYKEFRKKSRIGNISVEACCSGLEARPDALSPSAQNVCPSRNPQSLNPNQKKPYVSDLLTLNPPNTPWMPAKSSGPELPIGSPRPEHWRFSLANERFLEPKLPLRPRAVVGGLRGGGGGFGVSGFLGFRDFGI